MDIEIEMWDDRKIQRRKLIKRRVIFERRKDLIQESITYFEHIGKRPGDRFRGGPKVCSGAP